MALQICVESPPPQSGFVIILLANPRNPIKVWDVDLPKDLRPTQGSKAPEVDEGGLNFTHGVLILT